MLRSCRDDFLNDLSSAIILSQTFLGAAAGALGLALTASLGGSGVSISLPSAPQISLGQSSGSASKPAASAPKSTISFTKAPKGELLGLIM